MVCTQNRIFGHRDCHLSIFSRRHINGANGIAFTRGTDGRAAYAYRVGAIKFCPIAREYLHFYLRDVGERFWRRYGRSRRIPSDAIRRAIS